MTSKAYLDDLVQSYTGIGEVTHVTIPFMKHYAHLVAREGVDRFAKDLLGQMKMGSVEPTIQRLVREFDSLAESNSPTDPESSIPRKYYFIAYQGTNRQGSISVWNAVIDVSPMEYIKRVQKTEELGSRTYVDLTVTWTTTRRN